MKKLKLSDTERIISPEETVENAKKIIRDFNFQISFEIENLDGLYISTLRLHNQRDLKVENKFSMYYDFENLPAQGKGLSEIQSKASCLMELLERLTICQIKNDTRVVDVVDLKTSNEEKVEVDFKNLTSRAYAAGNSLEEAALHALTEDIEHNPILSTQCFGLDPFSVVDISDMNLPQWVKDSFVVLYIPHTIENIYHMQAIRFPKERDVRIKEYRKYDDIWRLISDSNYINTRNSSMSASLNPQRAIYRAIMEVFQRGNKERYSAEKRQIDWPTISINDLPNRETDSIEGDIDLLLNSVPEENKFFSVNLTSSDFNIPVVRVLSDINKEKQNIFSNSFLMKKIFKNL